MSKLITTGKECLKNLSNGHVTATNVGQLANFVGDAIAYMEGATDAYNKGFDDGKASVGGKLVIDKPIQDEDAGAGEVVDEPKTKVNTKLTGKDKPLGKVVVKGKGKDFNDKF